MLRYTYHNIIIIVTNVIISEFLLARFVPPCGLQLTILSFFNTSLNIRITETINTLNKLFFLITMTSEVLKYLIEQPGVFLNAKLVI